MREGKLENIDHCASSMNCPVFVNATNKLKENFSAKNQNFQMSFNPAMLQVDQTLLFGNWKYSGTHHLFTFCEKHG